MAEVIASYRPRHLPEAAGVFARAAVAAADPPSATRAKALLWSCARLGAFGISVGLHAEPAVLLHPSVIERFVIVGAGRMSGPTRRTLRTNLRHVAARVAPRSPAPVALSRERAKASYTTSEIAAWLALADSQPTVARRLRGASSTPSRPAKPTTPDELPTACRPRHDNGAGGASATS